MTSFLDNIKEFSRSPMAVYHKFRVSIRSDDILYLFVEGYDDKAYYSAVCDARGLKSRFYVTFGKKNLDDIYKEHDGSALQKENVKFIRDRDIDEFLGMVGNKKDLFLTCSYSVENYVFSAESIKKFLEYRFGLDPQEIDIDKDIQEFSSAVDSLNSWLIPLYAKAFECVNAKHPIDLNKLSADAYAKAILQGKPLPDDFPFHEMGKEEIFSKPPSHKAVEMAKNYVKEGHHRTIRGKYLTALSTEFIRKTAEKYMSMHKNKKIVNFNKSACSSINEDAVFAAIISYASPTKRLSTALSIKAAA